MPSDVARLVLGYLKDNAYVKTYNCFLKECNHLQEFYNLVKAGRPPRQISQLNLIVILEEWGQFKFQSERTGGVKKKTVESPSSDETLDETLVSDNDVTNSGRKIASKFRFASKISPRLKTRISPGTPKSTKSSPRTRRKTNSEDPTLTSNNNENFQDNLLNDNGNRYVTELSSKKLEVQTKEVCIEKTPEKSNPPSKYGSPLKSPREVNRLISSCCDVRLTVPTSGSAVEACTLPTARLTSFTENVNSPFKDVKTSKLKARETSTSIGFDNLAVLTSEGNSDLKNESTSKIDSDPVKSLSSQVLSKTFVKSSGELPEESVDIQDKCLSWIQKHGEDQACCNNVGSSSNRKTTDTSVLNCDVNEIVCDSKTSGRKDEMIRSHDGTSRVTEGSSSQGTSSKSGQGSNSAVRDDAIPARSLGHQGLTTPEKNAKNMTSGGDHATPVKFNISGDGKHVRSPRRKKPKTPRKRASEVSPVSVVSTKSMDLASLAAAANPMFETILKDHRLLEKLAETCNLVHSQIRQSSSGSFRKDKTRTKSGEELGTAHPAPDETITASRSLEEILGIEHFHTDLLSDNIDMSDPAYESLFKLFGTDRETFSEYLRKEKERELLQMEAEVEELERSNHEILCANFGVSQADAGYETQEVYSSPHHTDLGTQPDLFTTQHGSPRIMHPTSTPCGQGVPVSFTPLLRGNELGNSPVHSSTMPGGSQARSAGREDKLSPSSVATQPFSPVYSHASEPPTPRNQQHHTSCVSPYAPRTPMNDMYPHTPGQPESPHHSLMMHSTPTGPGSVRSQAHESFAHHSPINHHSNMVTGAMTACSPLVKADLHPNSPLMTQKNTPCKNNVSLGNHNSALYFNSQTAVSSTASTCLLNTDHGAVTSDGFLTLLNDNPNIPVSHRECSTIENTIGCISLPQPENRKPDASSPGQTSRRKRKGKPKPLTAKKFSTLKGLLAKPLKYTNSIPLQLTAGDLQKVLKTPEKKGLNPNLTFRSPGGKTMINVPVLNCEDEIDLSVLGMDGDIDDNNTSVNVYNQTLDSSTQIGLAPENQVTQDLMKAIAAGSSADVLQKIHQQQQQTADCNTKLVETKKTSSEAKVAVPERKTQQRKKKTEESKTNEEQSKSSKKKKRTSDELNKSGEKSKHTSPTLTSGELPEEGSQESSEEIYTATPVTGVCKAATVRALNFGPFVEDPTIAHFRKIYPKFPAVSTSSTLVILNTSQSAETGPKMVVTTTPIPIVPKPSTGESCNKENAEAKNNSGKLDDTIKEKESKQSEENSTVRQTRSASAKKKVKSCEKNDKVVTDLEKESKTRPKTPKRQSSKSSSMVRNLKDELDSLNSAVDASSDKKCDTSLKDRELNADTKSVQKNKKVSKPVINKKDKKSGGKEKLRVKVPLGKSKSPASRSSNKKVGKNNIQFYFKKNKSPVSSCSEDDIPLSEVRKTQSKRRTGRKQTGKKEYKSVKIIIESESSDEEGEAAKDTGKSATPKKVEKYQVQDDTPTKEALLEKVGLTPRKPPSDGEFKSPQRANMLDVMVEWQTSPRSRRKESRTPSVRTRAQVAEMLKSPTAPKQKTPAKQLFTSPCKISSDFESSNEGDTAQRVEAMINRLNKNNPDSSLSSVNLKEYSDKVKKAGNKEIKTISSKKVKQDGAKTVCENKVCAKKMTASKTKKSSGESRLTSKAKKAADIAKEKLETEEFLNTELEQCSNNRSDIKETANIEGSNGTQSNDSGLAEIPDDNSEVCKQNDMGLDEDSQGASELTRAIASIECETQFSLSGLEEHVQSHQFTEHNKFTEIAGQTEDRCVESLENKEEEVHIDTLKESQYDNCFKDIAQSMDITDTERNAVEMNSVCEDRVTDGINTSHGNKLIVIAEIHAEQNAFNRSPAQETREEITDGEKLNSQTRKQTANKSPFGGPHTSKEEKLTNLICDKKFSDLNDRKESEIENDSNGLNADGDNFKPDSEQLGDLCERKKKHKKKKHKHRPSHRHLGNSLEGSQSESSISFVTPTVASNGRDHSCDVQQSEDLVRSQSGTDVSFVTPLSVAERRHQHYHRHHHRHSDLSDTAGSQSEAWESSVSTGEKGLHHHKKKKSKKRHRDHSEDGHGGKRRKLDKSGMSADNLASLNVEEALSQIYGNT